ncbi:MAG: hypothetical protein HZA53_13810 [Planctomycetes bacterium]|nr:hypothetical protein [Planctomycetota bacterium]
MRTTAVSGLAVLALAFLPAAQDRDPGKPTPTATEKKTIEAKVAAMQGLWRVREMKTPRLEAARRLDAGFVLVSGLTFSIELHTGYVAPDGKNVINKDFQSGMHRFEIDDSGFMETKTVIGSFYNELGLLQFEQPNKERRYEVKLGAEDMSWTNADGTSFLFEKLNEPKAVRRDVFGRPIPEKKKDAKEPK